VRGVRVGLLATAIVVAGCSGATALTHGEFTRRASRVCDAANRRVGSRAGSLQDPGPARAMLGHVVGVEREALARLHRLVPPARDLARVDEWLALHAQLLAEIDTVRDELRAKHLSAAAVALDRATILAGRAHALARANGVRPCRTPMPRPT
jgi:hypothetical protein